MSSTAGAVERGLAVVDQTTVARRFIGVIGWALGVLISALAVILLARRLSGAFDRPLGVFAMAAVALALAGMTLLTRRFWQSTECLALSTGPRIEFGVLSAVAVTILASLTLPRTPAAGMAVAWLILIGCEVGQGLYYLRPELWRQWFPLPMSNPAVLSNVARDQEEAAIPAGLIQQLTRVRDGENESLHALVRAEIPAADRLGIIHLSFCPPLSEAPLLTAHAIDAENVAVRITQAESFGARIEARLSQEAAMPRSVIVEVLGTVTARPNA